MKRPFETFTRSHRSSTRAARPKRRLCRLESLERRDLLSAVPLSASEYAALTAQYSSLSLPETMDDLNVITLDLSEGDGLADLQSAIVKAAHTYESELIVVRTTVDANTASADSRETLQINIDSVVFGTLTIVGLGDAPLTLNKVGIQASGDNTDIGLANLKITGASDGIIANSCDITITDCVITGNEGFGIYSDNTTTTITDCVITGNEDYGIYSNNTTTTITDCVITGNEDYGIYSYNTVTTITDCVITENKDDGIYSYYSTTTITDCEITENEGYGIYSYSHRTTTITNSEIDGNSQRGIYIEYSKSGTIINTNITNNTASQAGGGIYIEDGTWDIVNSLIADNTADNYGAGIFNESGTVKITNSTITGNTTKIEGSGGIRNNTSSGKVELYNTIVVGNTGDISGWVSGSNNLTTSAQWQSGENNLTYDAALPLFKDEENGDYSLAEGSQAADRGSNELAELAGLDELAKDLAGNARFQNDSIDIGAFESGDVKIQLPPTVTLNKIPTFTNAPITLTWKAEDADGDLALCEVWVSKDGAEFVRAAENVTDGKYVFAFDGDGRYSFKVTAVDEDGNLAESEVQECVFDSTAPVVILGEVPAQTNAESVTLTWTAEDAKFCEVWVSKDGAEFVRAAENVTDGEYTHMFNGEGQYTFRIVAIDEAGNESGPAEGQVTFKTAAPPNVTFGYMPEIVNSQSEYLMWFADDPDNDLAYCELYVSKDGAEFERLGGDWTDMGCMVNFDSSGTYRFQIIAVDAAGNRSDADEIEIRAELSTNISSVTFGDIPTSIDQRSVHLYWSCNIKAVSYILTVFQGETKLETIETSKNSKIWTAEEDGDYRFCVVAVDEAGNHSEPAEITINVQTCQVHCMFLISPGTVTTEELDLIWQVEDTMEGDFAYGELYVSKDGGEPVLVSGNLTETMYSYRFESNGLYQFQIYAFDKAGNRSNADSLEVQVELNALPVRFDDIPTSTNSKNIDLHWTCKTEAVSYLLTVSLEGRELATIQMTGNSLTWTAEEDGNYLFRVSAIDAGGNYSEPAEQYVSVETCPVNVMLYSIWEEEGYIKLFWQVEDTIEEDFAYCELYVSKDGAEYQRIGGELTGCEYSYHYETDGSYSFRIYAIDKAGNRSRANEAGIIVDHTAPTVTLGEIAQMTKDEEILLTWTVNEFASCTVWVSKDDAEFVKAAENVTGGEYAFTFEGDGRYSFKVTAVDEAGNLAESEALECVFDSTAPVVILGEVPEQTNAESVTLTWTADGAAFCEVWVSKDGAEFVRVAENVTGGEYVFAFDGDGRYSFKVAAVDEAGNRAESEVVDVEKKPNISAVVSGNRVKVVWENDGPEADSVRYREAGTQRWTVRKLKAGVSEFAFNGRAGKEYEIQVLCGQQEDRILTESVTLLVSPKMKAERNSVTDESFAVNVSNWAGQLYECASMVCVTLNGERQEIALENGRGSCVFSGGETAEFADGVLRFGNVKSNFQHTVRVAFSNGESTSAETSPLRIRTAMAAYDAPVIESVEALDGKSVCVTWTTAYGKNSTQAAKYYTVQYSTDGERWRTAATRAEGNAFILTNLKAQTQYLVSVFATRDRDFTASVPSESTLVKTAFPTPAITSARSTQTGRVVISWKSVSDAAQYELAYRETESSKWSVIPVSSSDAKVTFTLFGLNSGKDYEFRLRALPLDTTIQTSGWSGIKTVKKIK